MRRKVFVLVVILLTAQQSFAAGPAITLTVDDLVYILYTSLAVTGLAALLSVASYFVRGKILNFCAWLLTVLSMVASIPITFTAYGMYSPVIPFLCLLLLARTQERRKPAEPQTGMQVLKAIAFLALFFITAKLLADVYSPDFFAHVQTQIFFIIYFNLVLGMLLYRMQMRLQKEYMVTPRLWQVITWSALIGAGTLFADINYIATTSLAVHYQKLTLSYVLLHMPYPNIFVNIACWACTAIVVFKISVRENSAVAVA